MFPLNVACSTEQPLAASGNKTLVSGNGSGFTPCGDPGTTDVVTVTASGGRAPYTYAWARVGGAASSGPYQAASPTSNATSFSDASNNVCASDVITDETWRCTVTDDLGREAVHDVTVRLTWTDLS